MLTAMVSAQSPTPAALQPIYWRQNLLTVPYQWSTPAGAPSSKSVWLYVSKDRGASWKPVADGESRLLSFNYRAEADGEYWFAVHTSEGRDPRPPSSTQEVAGLQPELRVVVDTIAPRLESLSAQLVDARTLEVRWRAADANLGTQSCTVEAQVGPAGEWQVVPLGQEAQVGADRWEGTARLIIPAGVRPGAVRATVADLAGNRARSQASIGADGTAWASGAEPTSLALHEPSWISESIAPIVANQYAAVAEPQLWPADRNGRLLRADSVGAHSLAYGTPVSKQETPITPVSDVNSLRLPEPISEERPRGPVQPKHDWIGDGNANRTGDVFHTASLMSSAAVPATPDTKAVADFHVVPPPENPLARRVNSRSFAVEYELANIGAAGIATVEAWGTHDGGRNWQRYAVDDDNRSPLEVTVDGEGEYGFTIIVRGAGSESSVPPQPGDTPALWVEVDLEPPIARILEVNAARGKMSGELTVRWVAEDDHLEPQPIALYYSSRPTGPWTPIATSIENLGEFTWPIERHVPRRVYLKLEARDSAGNVTAFQTAEAVITESEPVVAKWQRLPPVQ